MSGTQDDFSISVGKWVALAKERSRIAFIAIGFEALAAVKEKTPVRTGWLRSNWQIQREGETMPVIRGALPADPARAMEKLQEMKDEAATSGAMDARQAADGAMEAQIGEKLRIVNPVVYARAIEYGREIEKADGTTVRTNGAAMVQQTMAEIPTIAEAVVRNITGRSAS